MLERRKRIRWLLVALLDRHLDLVAGSRAEQGNRKSNNRSQRFLVVLVVHFEPLRHFSANGSSYLQVFTGHLLVSGKCCD